MRREIEDIALLISAEGDQLSYEAGQASEILKERLIQQVTELEARTDEKKSELRELRRMTFLTESRFHDLHDRWGNVFKAKMGAEAFLDICKQIDLDALGKELRQPCGRPAPSN